MSQHIINDSLGFLLSVATQSLHRQLNRAFHSKGFGITYEQWSILVFLENCDGKSQNEIAENTYRDKVSVTKIIDNLERYRLVKRALDENDRRIRRIFLTNEGREIIPELKGLINNTLGEAFKNSKKNDLESFSSILSLIVKNLTGEDLQKFVKNNKRRWK